MITGFWILFAFLLGVGVADKLHKWMEHEQMPYRWGPCPEDGCSFTVKGNDMKIVDRMVSNHERSHNE